MTTVFLYPPHIPFALSKHVVQGFMPEPTLSFFFNFLFFFLAALGLRCCARAFSSCGEQGLLFIAVRGLLIAEASLLLRSLGSRHAGFSNCSTQAQ